MGPALGASPARCIAVACCVLQWPLLGHPTNADADSTHGARPPSEGGGTIDPLSSSARCRCSLGCCKYPTALSGVGVHLEPVFAVACIADSAYRPVTQ